MIKDEVMAVFRDLHRMASFIKFINSTFMIFIPKIIRANNIKSFRPISLVGNLYRLISNVLIKRMSKVFGEVIGEKQNAFMAGRQILDAVMVANEIVADMVGQKQEDITCKIDMEKTYDHVCWEFVMYMLERLGLERSGGNGLGYVFLCHLLLSW